MQTPKFLKNVVNYVSKKAGAFKSIVLAKYGEQPGKMLVHTGVLGWILSSLAQITAVAFNDKIPAEQKVFLIPQEIADAAVNILSFYIVTQSVKSLGSKLVTSGKISNPKIREFVAKLGKNSDMGKWDFDIRKLNGFSAIKDDFTNFKNGVDVYASLAGSIASCNIITPVIRNRYAAEKQKDVLARMNDNRMKYMQAPRGVTMNEYLNRVYAKNSSLKV